jgi:hypothetical protein
MVLRVKERLLLLGFVIAFCLSQSGMGQPLEAEKALGSQTCMTSGCHGGAGPGRGAYSIWKQYDPHFDAAATLTNGRSRAMARQLGIDNAAEAQSCTVCHSPLRQIAPSELPAPPEGHKRDSGVSCASCHGPADQWLLSHTRPDYPQAALARLGMRQLATSYQRANNCVACHQNLSNQLVEARHPPLVFELDGLMVAEPKHWREEEGFSHVKSWLVGQAVALRETAAQANREPGPRRTAEIEAIRALLNATATGWNDSTKDLVRSADDFAIQISESPMSQEQSRAILLKLIRNRTPFQTDTFAQVAADYRSWSIGYYAERLTLAIDRLNQSLISSGQSGMFAKDFLNALFDAAKPPESFDAATTEAFVQQLDRLKMATLDLEKAR